MVPSLDEITKWAAIANEILTPTPASTLSTCTATFGAISKAPGSTACSRAPESIDRIKVVVIHV
ncbi:BQ2448_2891 [Microbotryum intermedium]|uniref:BQ2448_2891 protein n=1 Tax=Microbotryum intermedium TaxID=269621 RepID=A0A238FH23_9BASI|nr:BQ2448_2891 [Microbotryum intermedium]